MAVACCGARKGADHSCVLLRRRKPQGSGMGKDLGRKSQISQLPAFLSRTDALTRVQDLGFRAESSCPGNKYGARLSHCHAWSAE